MQSDEFSRLAFYEEHWHTELSRIQKEAVLIDHTQHEYLSTLWDSCPHATSWIAADAIADTILVDVIGQSGMSLVCSAYASNGDVLCVKFPNYAMHTPESWGDLAKAVRNESQILQRLADIDVRFGQIPKFVADGELDLAETKLPYIVTHYIFGLNSVAAYGAKSQKTEMDFWTNAARLLGEVHGQGIVHGDLHYGNLLVNATGKPALLDFGNSQLRTGWPFKLRSERRHFGPLVALHIDEVLAPHQPLSFAFDVFCLTELMRKRLGDYFQLANKPSPQLLQNIPNGSDQTQQATRFHLLIKKCTQPEPEYRLSNAKAVANALSDIASGPAVDMQRRLSTNLRVLLRKHFLLSTVTFTFVVLLLSVTGFVMVQLQHQKDISQQQTIQAQKDTASLKRLREANRAALDSMQELIQGSLLSDRVLEEVNSDVRENVSQRLIDLINSEVLDADSQIAALGLAQQITSAVMELDGWEAATPSTLAVLELAEGIESNSTEKPHPEIPLFAIRGLATRSKILFEKGGLARSEKPAAAQLAQSAARRFLDLSIADYETQELKKAYMETGFQVARHALYPQRSEDWLKRNHADILWKVINQALRIAEEEPEHFVRQVASLRRLYGVALHKGTFRGSPRFPAHASIMELSRQQYFQVLELLLSNSEISARESRNIEAEVKSVLGMSWTNQGNFQEARDALRDAFQIRKTSAEEFPGSLKRQRELISTGWNYADTFRQEAIVRFNKLDGKTLRLQEINMRSLVVEKCRQVLFRDRNGDSEYDYFVNSVRLASAHFFCDQDSLAADVMKEVETQMGLEYFEFEGHGFDTLVGLVILAKQAEDTRRYVPKFNAYFDEALTYLKRIEREKTPAILKSFGKSSTIFIDAVDEAELGFVQTCKNWQEIKHLLREMKSL